MRAKFVSLYHAANQKFLEQFGFCIKDTTFNRLVNYMFVPKDSSSLAVTRILFGVCMLFDIADERGGASLAQRWGSTACHFPLLGFLQPMALPYMAMVYTVLWFGALGIVLGYKYELSSLLFVVSYWYIFLIDKSFWNNHSYLFGLVAILLATTEANCCWSLDSMFNSTIAKEFVPYWNFFILKYQFFILYFMAGLKKGTAEWLTGYSVQRLSEHWVFDPFKLFLTVSQTDYLIVHWFIFVFDLTIAVWMMMSLTRNYAMVLCALFHLMNSRLFTIGMFPWVCLATMPLFYPFDWPKRAFHKVKNIFLKMKTIRLKNAVCKMFKKRKCSKKSSDSYDEKIMDKDVNSSDENVFEDADVIKCIHNQENIGDREECDKPVVKELPGEKNKKIRVCSLIFMYVILQAFLPFSHFITEGYNNWTNGLYGYSWDMMVHSWESQSIVIKVVDNQNNKEYFLDPHLHTLNDRWSRHGDMVYQYAHCLKRNIKQKLNDKKNVKTPRLSENISIYFDVWYSLNRRFTQRMFDPKVDMLKTHWSPFQKISYLMPLLDEALGWRSVMEDIRQEVHSWNNHSNVIFYADFPGYDQEKYIPAELQNVSLSVLNGTVLLEPDLNTNDQSFKLSTGDHIRVESNAFHKVINIGKHPTYYMYTFLNTTDVSYDEEVKPKLPIGRELVRRVKNMFVFGQIVYESIRDFMVAIVINVTMG